MIPPPPAKAKALLKKKEHRDKEIDESLETIYRGDQPTSDFSRLDRRKSYYWLRLLSGAVALLGVLTLAAWAGFNWLQPLQSSQVKALSLQLEGPTEITVGQEQTFAVVWKNADIQTISRVQIQLGFPQDFIPTSFQPSPDAHGGRIWNIGLASAQQQGKILVKGIFLGPIGQTHAWQAIGTYRANASGRDDEALVTQTLVYTKSAIQGVGSGPARVIAGDPYTFVYTVQNTSAEKMERLLLRLSYPEGFALSASSSMSNASTTSPLLLPIAPLASQTSSTLRVQGAFRPSSAGDAQFLAEVGKLDATGQFIPMHATTTAVAVLAGDLAIKAIVNGTDSAKSIATGEPLRISVAYQNTSPEHMKDVTITLGFESSINGVSATGTSLLDWSQLQDEQTGVTSTRKRIQTVLFDKKSVPALGDLAPQAEGSFDITLPTLRAATGTESAVIAVSVVGQMTLGSNDSVKRLVRVPAVVLTYRTDAELSAFARYFTEEGAPIGVGPLPPVVGKATSYRIYWNLHKTLHTLDRVVMQAQLPASVSWLGRVASPAGVLAYTTSTRTVRWEINKMPRDVHELEGSFDVEIVPKATEGGRFAFLLEQLALTANDSSSNEQVARTEAPVTTDLQNDEGARGKGVVKKE